MPSEPKGPLPPLPGTVKLDTHWFNDAGAQAHNIAYCFFVATGSSADPTTLQATANALMTAWGAANLAPIFALNWHIKNVTATDNGGTSSNQAVSTSAQIDFTVTAGPFPPQVAVTVSWSIAARYRGGKPRWYLPGANAGMVAAIGSSTITTAVANSIATKMNTLEASFNASAPGTHDVILGTISHYTNYTIRPTPLFRAFGTAKVHTRLDSQRRRSGKEVSIV